MTIFSKGDEAAFKSFYSDATLIPDFCSLTPPLPRGVASLRTDVILVVFPKDLAGTSADKDVRHTVPGGPMMPAAFRVQVCSVIS